MRYISIQIVFNCLWLEFEACHVLIMLDIEDLGSGKPVTLRAHETVH